MTQPQQRCQGALSSDSAAAAPQPTLAQPLPIRDKVRSAQEVTPTAQVPATISPFN